MCDAQAVPGSDGEPVVPLGKEGEQLRFLQEGKLPPALSQPSPSAGFPTRLLWTHDKDKMDVHKDSE